MVQIHPKVVPELVGVRSFGFKAHNHSHVQTKLFGTPSEKENQDRRISDIRTVMESLKNFPCEANLTIGCENGHTNMTGQIWTYDQVSMDKAEAIVAEADRVNFSLSRQYILCSFQLEFSQTIEIYNVQR